MSKNIEALLTKLKHQIEETIQREAEQQITTALNEISTFVSSFKQVVPIALPVIPEQPKLEAIIKKPKVVVDALPIELETKTCIRCGKTKLLSEFHKSGHGNMYRADCKECANKVRSLQKKARQQPKIIKAQATTSIPAYMINTDPNRLIGKRRSVPPTPNKVPRIPKAP